MENKISIHVKSTNNHSKEHDEASVVGANTKNKGHMKSPWNHIYTSSAYASEEGIRGLGVSHGLLWPPRLYVCSFCKREFRSAQALGGHMNVHRRDRARLRQSPPSPPMQLVAGDCPPATTAADSINLNLIPSPNPSLIYSSTWVMKKTNFKTATCINGSSTTPDLKPSSPYLISSSSSSAPASGIKRCYVASANPFTTSATTTITPNLFDANNYEHHNNFSDVSLNRACEKGRLLRIGFGNGGLRNEDVDLELRLGYSS